MNRNCKTFDITNDQQLEKSAEKQTLSKIETGYETIDEQQLYSGRLFTLVKRTVRCPDGSTIERTMALHPPVVFMLVHRTDTDAYLTERQYRVGTERLDMELPAGFIEQGETPAAAARRELKEETGLDLASSHASLTELPHASYSSPGFTNEKASLFAVELETPVMGKQNLDDDEQLTFGWTPADDLYTHLESGDITSSVAQAMLYREFLRREQATH